MPHMLHAGACISSSLDGGVSSRDLNRGGQGGSFGSLNLAAFVPASLAMLETLDLEVRMRDVGGTTGGTGAVTIW